MINHLINIFKVNFVAKILKFSSQDISYNHPNTMEKIKAATTSIVFHISPIFEKCM